MVKTAQCNCGALKAETPDEALVVVACHCTDCQRRTGSVMGVGAYYKRDKVKIIGESQSFSRASDGGRDVTHNFCPVCGTSLFWVGEVMPDIIGVAVGGFGDTTFPVPMASIWEQSQHSWLRLPDGVKHFAKGMSGG